MARNSVNTAILRWSVRDEEKWRRQFQAVGPEAEQMFDRMSRSARPANDNLKALDRTSSELRDGFEDLASRAGPLGNILRALGPAGLAAAAGIGAAVAAGGLFLRWLDQARDTTRFAGDLESVSLSAGVAAADILDLRTALQLAGAAGENADAAIEEFNKRLGEFRAFGTGELRDAVEQLGLGDALRDGRLPVEAALDRVLDALEDIEDPSRRLSLADKLGLRDAAPLLQRSADEIARIRDLTSEINAGFSAAQQAELALAEARFREIELRFERNRQVRSFAVLDEAVTRQEALLGLDELRTAAVLQRRDLEDLSIAQLEDQLAVQNRLLAMRGMNNAQIAATGSALSLVLNLLNDEVDATERIRNLTFEIAQRRIEAYLIEANSGRPRDDDDGSPGEDSPSVSLEERRQAEARLAAQMERARSPAERYAAAVRQIRDDYAALTDEQRAALGVTEDWVDRMILAERIANGLADATALLSRAEREKVWLTEDMAAVQEAWNRIAGDSITAEQRAETAIKEINEALAWRLSQIPDLVEGEIGYAEAMAQRAEAESIAAEAIKRVNRAEIERAAAFAAGSVEQERLNALDALKLELLGEVADPEAAMIERRRELNTLVEAGTISQERANRELALYRAELAQLEAEMAGFTGLGKLIADGADLREGLDGVATDSLTALSRGLVDVMRDFDNAGEAAGRFFDTIVEGLMELAVQRYIIGPLADALFGFLDGVMPGAASAGLSAVTAPKAGAMSGASVASVAAAAAAAQRPALAGGQIETVTVHGAPEGSEARSAARPGRDGGIDLDVWIEGKIARSAERGQLGRILKQRGLGPVPVARSR
ncbi:hypothetical protein [Hyphobacterium sp.]|uniref:hypothetical protein n=1 Tax=Hyphobacterium sp. TaxID=2004662 RepID=UPI003B51C5E9